MGFQQLCVTYLLAGPQIYAQIEVIISVLRENRLFKVQQYINNHFSLGTIRHLVVKSGITVRTFYTFDDSYLMDRCEYQFQTSEDQQQSIDKVDAVFHYNIETSRLENIPGVRNLLKVSSF